MLGAAQQGNSRSVSVVAPVPPFHFVTSGRVPPLVSSTTHHLHLGHCPITRHGWQVSVHEKSRYARRMFELMRMEIEEQARRFRQQSDSDTLASFLTFT